jgi:type I restriction enzyme S subunit
MADEHERYLAQLPAEWQRVHFDQLGAIVGGGTPSRGETSFWGGSIPWVTPGELTELEGPVLYETREKITESGVRASAATPMPPRSVLITTRATIGQVALSDMEVSTNQGFRSLVPEAGVDAGYCYHLVRHVVGEEMRRLAAGSTFDEISRTDLAAIEVGLPDIDEQRSVAEAIFEADEAIQVGRRERDKLLAVRYAVEADAVRQARSSGEHQELAELFDIQLGKMLSAAARGGRYSAPYLANRNVQWDRVDLDDLPEMTFSAAEREKFSLRRGDLLVCEGGEVGRTAIWQEELDECYFQKAIHRLRPVSDQIAPRYMLAFMRVALRDGELAHLVGQTSIAHLTKEKLATVTVPLLGADQQAHVEILESLDTQLALAAALVGKLTASRDGLAADLLQGRRRLGTTRNDAAA